MKQFWKLVLSTLIVLTFSACGGGGGDSKKSPSGNENNITQIDQNTTSDKDDKKDDGNKDDGKTPVNPAPSPSPSPQAKTFKISGYVIDEPVSGAKITLFNSKSKELYSTTTKSDGSYLLTMSEAQAYRLEKEPFLYVEAMKNGKTLRGFILGFNTAMETYQSSDVYISHYSEALFQIKDALSLDLKSTSILYENFMNSYSKGEFKEDKYYFAFTPIMEDLANNVKANFYQDKSLYTKDEIIAKIKMLNNVDYQTLKRVKKYSFPLLQQKDDSITLQVISFDDYNVSNSFSVDMEKKENTKSPFYDRAVISKVNFSDQKAILRNVDIKLFDVNTTSMKNLYSDEYKEELKNKDTSVLIENRKIKLILSNEGQKKQKKSRSVEDMILENFTRIIYEDGKVFVRLVFDISKLTFSEKYINSYEIVVKAWAYEHDFWTILNDSEVTNTITIARDKGVYKYDITPLLTKDLKDKNKHIPIRFQIYEDDLLGDDAILEKFFAFVDWNKDYKNATLGQDIIFNTRYGKNFIPLINDNNFKNKVGFEDKQTAGVVTHRIIDFDKIVTKDIQYNLSVGTKWKDTNYAQNVNHYANTDRIPLLLIHGWQGGKGQTNPATMLRYENNEFAYFQNLISYYLATPEIYKKYKLYTYHYPSYKHITFNARMLKKIFDEKIDKNSVLYKGYKKKNGLFIIGHSMGGLISRSFIEEHKALGNNAQNLLKLITLDTPHHGSVSVITTYSRTHLANRFVKNLDTPGAIDLMWDNYDKHYGVLDEHHMAATNYSGNSRGVRSEDYRYSFDRYYLEKIKNKNGFEEMNPFLTYLNQEFVRMKNTLKNKYILYTAINIFRTQNIIDTYNTASSDLGMSLNTELMNDIGYAAGGAEPVESSLFTFQTMRDDITKFDKDINSHWDLTNDKLPPFKNYVYKNNEGDTYNNNLPYRIFWDYDHETVMNGQISKKIASNYIDAEDLMDSYQDKNTNFKSVVVKFDKAYARNEYILCAMSDNYEVKSDYTPIKSKYNPLKYEPVFLVLKKDLGVSSNNKPVAVKQDVSLPKNTSKDINLSGTDKDGDKLIYDIVTQPLHGTISGTVPNIIYTPDKNYVGNDSFTFKVNDGLLDSNETSIGLNIYEVYKKPIAIKQNLVVYEDDKLDITLSGIVGDGDAIAKYEITEEPGHGDITGIPPNITYQRSNIFDTYHGKEYISFRVYDGKAWSDEGTLEITIKAGDAPTPTENRTPFSFDLNIKVQKNTPTKIKNMAKDLDNDPLTYILTRYPKQGSFDRNTQIYTPFTNRLGKDSFMFQASDGQSKSVESTVVIHIVDEAPSSNTTPVANAQSVSTNKNTAKPITLSGTDAEGNPLTYTITSQPSHGTLNPPHGTTPNVTYTPNANYTGNDSFTFKVNDGTEDSNEAIVSIIVNDTTPTPTSSSKVLKTGQTKSYTNYDDGYYQKGLDRSYSRSGNIVTDNTTKLQWQDDEAAKTTKKNWEGAKTYCNTLILDGYDDWILPTARELRSILDLGRYNPAVDPVFQNISSATYWTSTARPTTVYQMVVSFHNSNDYANDKSLTNNVRCVRIK